MASIDFSIMAGDTLPVIEAQLLDAAGVPVDLTDATEIRFQMALEGSTELAVDAAAAATDAWQGNVEYGWADGDTADYGAYRAVFRVTGPAGMQTYPPAGFLRVLVQPSLSSAVPVTAAPFVTLADVLEATGRDDVSEQDLNIAWSVLESIIGRPLYEITLAVLTARDTYWLKKAAAWQAAWVADNPDVFSAFDVSSMNQTGQSATFAADGQVIAPMARRSLRWVTWMKSRSVKIQQPIPFSRLANPTVADDLGNPWRSTS